MLVLDKTKVQLASYKAYKAGARVILNQGGTRSSKTYGVTKLNIGIALKEKVQISITSLSLPHLKKGAMKDWKEIMNNYNLYDQNAHRRTDRAYDYPSGSYIEFFSVDDSLKVRGPGRDVLFINELNLIEFETFIQLLLRTKKCVFGDYNPADEFHWIYDELLAEFVYQDGDVAWFRRKGKKSHEKPDVAFIKSTYLDNPFLPHEQVKEIENLKNVDENFWRIYGEGERGHSEGVIFTHWQPFTGDTGNKSGICCFGLDFGYNNPSCLVRVVESDQNLYWKEEIYQSGLTTNDLIPMLKQIVKPHEPVYCDSAEPDRIKDLQRAGIKAIAANKNVKDGIDFVKSRKLFIHSGSANLLKEIKSYKYMTKQLGITEVPLKLNDHACFIADTLVISGYGLKRIGDIEPGELVLTSEGFRLVLFKFNNGLKQIKKYSLLFDTFSVHLECTPDHLIKTEQGWIQISKLELGMMVNLFNFSEEENILFIQERGTSEATNTACIGMSGNITTVRGQKDSIYTTLMKIHGTIGSLIWNAGNLARTYHTTSDCDLKTIQSGQRSFNQNVLSMLKSGIKALKVLLGTKSTRQKISSDQLHTVNDFAQYVHENSKQIQPRMSSVTQTAKLRRFVEGEGNYQVVFDLAVDECHEYFANGVLVHNCDAGRYASISFKKPKSSLNVSFQRS